MRQSRDSIALGQRPLIGIAVESVTTYGRSILRGVVRYADLQRKWVLHKDLWCTTDSTLQWPDCDGSIIAGVPASVHEDVVAHSRYAVTCSGSYDPKLIPAVVLDDEATAAMAAKHLIDCGLRHFACYGPHSEEDSLIGDRPRFIMHRRFRGFQQALIQSGHSCASSHFDFPSHRDLFTHTHHARVIQWLKSLPKPIGIFAIDDMMAHDLAEACREADIGVPEHVAIVGVNNDDLLCESAWPPLSSVEADFSRMGYLAAKMLDRLLNGETLTAEERFVRLPPIRVRQRLSTDVIATDQPDVADAVRYIREHACDPCSVEDVLNAVPIGRRSLERQFVQALGRTPYDEIARVRVETARRLLLQADVPIRNIAELCGFSVLQSFNRAFLKATGVTPSAFRRQSLKGAGGRGR